MTPEEQRQMEQLRRRICELEAVLEVGAARCPFCGAQVPMDRP